MAKHKYIAFIGDSYCATYNRKSRHNIVLTQSKKTDSAYTSIVSDHYGCDTAPYGFGGKSWWFSWSKFWKDWGSNLTDLEAVVFVHTNSDRINSTYPDLPLMPNYSRGPVELISANQDYYKYIHDTDFNIWAQQNYFRMIKEKFNYIKTVHLHCFTTSVEHAHLLPGISFTTPLIHITVGEVRGTAEHIAKSMSDGRPNHLSERNNQVLADVIINALDNYSPGMYPLPIEKFEQYNPNAANWPHGVYWTE